jgi:glycosyltransferase involved in cell wall biosynthesis
MPRQVSLSPIPVVLDLDDPAFSPEEEAALRNPTLRHLIVTTDESAQHMRATSSGIEVTMVPQGVDLDRASRARHQETRKELLLAAGLPDDTVIVGCHAPVLCLAADRAYRDASYRTFDIDVLMTSIRRLWSAGASFITVLVGKPSPSIREVARNERRLILAGYVDRDRLFDWVGAFDIGTYPRTVGFGGRQSVKLLEYMANDAAVVAMRTAETSFLDDANTGYTAASADAFTAALRRLIESPGERRALVNRARPLVAAHDWNFLAARYDGILAAVAAAA